MDRSDRDILNSGDAGPRAPGEAASADDPKTDRAGAQTPERAPTGAADGGAPVETGAPGEPSEADGVRGRLQHLLEAIAHAGWGERVSVEEAMDAIGSRSFGALLLVPSLVLVSPLSGVPGVPTVAGAIIVLICVQYLMGRDRIWLPRRVRQASLSRSRLHASLYRVRPVVRTLDRLVRPRLTFLINRLSCSLGAVVCAGLAMTLPPLEALPFVSTATATVIALFGFAMLARDGLVALVALLGTGAAIAGVVLFAIPKVLGLLT